jgi:hypothetical protein
MYLKKTFKHQSKSVRLSQFFMLRNKYVRHHVGSRLQCNDATAEGKSEKRKISNLIQARVGTCEENKLLATHIRTG